MNDFDKQFLKKSSLKINVYYNLSILYWLVTGMMQTEFKKLIIDWYWQRESHIGKKANANWNKIVFMPFFFLSLVMQGIEQPFQIFDDSVPLLQTLNGISN